MTGKHNFRRANDITSFSGPHAFLSNFWVCSVNWEGELWLSVEHAYVAAKSPEPLHRAAVKAEPKPGKVKALGRKATLVPDWELKKVPIMKELVLDKFTRNRVLRQMLVATEDRYLVEGNHWGDKFWGQVDGEGLNLLGEILMETREKMKSLL